MGNMISVIVPVYNVEKYIRRCVNSILNQTYSNLEVILVDDGSTDESGKICDQYLLQDERVKVIHKKNGGVSSARNEGIEICRGDYLSFIDADDWLDLNMYEAMMSGNCYDMVVCSYRLYFSEDEDPVCADPWNKKTAFISYDGYHDVLCKTAVLWNKLLPMSCVKDLRFEENQCYGEDSFFLCKVLKRVVDIKIICEPLYNYYVGREGNVVSSKVDTRVMGLLDVSKGIYDELKCTEYVSCGVFRIKSEVETVLKKIIDIDSNEKEKYLKYCINTIRYPDFKDIIAFQKDKKFKRKTKVSFLMCYFVPRLYSRIRYGV